MTFQQDGQTIKATLKSYSFPLYHQCIHKVKEKYSLQNSISKHEYSRINLIKNVLGLKEEDLIKNIKQDLNREKYMFLCMGRVLITNVFIFLKLIHIK